MGFVVGTMIKSRVSIYSNTEYIKIKALSNKPDGNILGGMNNNITK